MGRFSSLGGVTVASVGVGSFLSLGWGWEGDDDDDDASGNGISGHGLWFGWCVFKLPVSGSAGVARAGSESGPSLRWGGRVCRRRWPRVPPPPPFPFTRVPPPLSLQLPVFEGSGGWGLSAPWWSWWFKLRVPS